MENNEGYYDGEQKRDRIIMSTNVLMRETKTYHLEHRLGI